jgi:hypothetical protein
MESPATAPTLTEDGVAAALQIAPMSFRRRRKHLEEKGFPKPLPHMPQGRWSRAQVLAWINGQTAVLVGAEPGLPMIVNVTDPAAEDRAYLERAYGGRS